MLEVYRRLASQNLRKMRNLYNHFHIKRFSHPINLQVTRKRIDSRVGPITNSIILQERHLSKNWSSFGMIVRTKSSQTRDETRNTHSAWKNGVKQEVGWKLRLLAKKNIWMQLPTLLKLEVGRGPAGRLRIINLPQKHSRSSFSHLPQKRRLTLPKAATKNHRCLNHQPELAWERHRLSIQSEEKVVIM